MKEVTVSALSTLREALSQASLWELIVLHREVNIELFSRSWWVFAIVVVVLTVALFVKKKGWTE